MKKMFAFIMAALLMLSFTGCSLLEKPGEFDYIVQLLEDEDYEEAIEEIQELMEDEEPDRDDEGEAVAQPPAEETAAPTQAAVEETSPAPEEEVPASEDTSTAPTLGSVQLFTGLTITEVDNLGNEDTSSYYFYDRDDQGRIVMIGGHEMAISYGFYLNTFADYLRLTYTPDGKIESAKVVDSWDNVSALGTPTYDESGNMVSMHIVTNTEEFTLNFSYDANGNCIHADIYDTFWQEIAFSNTYTYDTQGCLVKEVWDMVGFGNTGKTVDYTYDENGHLVQSYTTWHESTPWHETTVYTLNDAGDPILAVTTSDTTESGYKTKTTEYIYSSYYISP